MLSTPEVKAFLPVQDRRIYIVWIALVWAAMIGWDLWRHGRVHPALLAGAALIAAGEAAAVGLEFSPGWRAAAASLVAAWGWTG
jgi:hypothetical protein